eukprot:NODE_9524_length_260_cov_13.611374_g8783_i0.p1 GENE.NODE_9524_length_260_cov_13.611374_g8783_i0~~NODE_9524_length_260_cov_13.611374_g8783_i0.p1  ORF type:complete len:63 (+),score=6.65 NODE_9524_length_260_cov_13.611374_g8783_i0:30-218(+)
MGKVMVWVGTSGPPPWRDLPMLQGHWGNVFPGFDPSEIMCRPQPASTYQMNFVPILIGLVCG